MKVQIQKLKSSKLFYGKWPYRIETEHPAASRIIRNGVNNVKLWCRTGRGLFFGKYDTQKVPPVGLLEFTEAVEPFIGRTDLQIRAEGSHLNIFCKEKEVLEELENALKKWIVKISGPTSEEELEFLLSNDRRKILCDALPKEKYRYKVIIKSSFPSDKREGFLTWSERYLDKIEIAKSTKRWLSGDTFWIQDPFFYVEDDKMLSMAGLYLSGFVKRVEHFIPRDSVLTA